MKDGRGVEGGRRRGLRKDTILTRCFVDHIFFTGSTHVGRIVATAAAKQLTTVTLELG